MACFVFSHRLKHQKATNRTDIPSFCKTLPVLDRVGNNFVPRVLSYSVPGGRVGEDPGNEVALEKVQLNSNKLNCKGKKKLFEPKTC